MIKVASLLEIHKYTGFSKGEVQLIHHQIHHLVSGYGHL